MALNLPEIGQLAIRNLKNAGEIVRNLWRLHFDPNPQDVLTEIYDENGNLKTVSIPNVAKWRDVIWRDAQSAMAKTFYVDQVNGSDVTGDGSDNNPFASPEKAIEVAPYIVDIYLKEGQTFTLQKSVAIFGKIVRFRRWGNTSGVPAPTITTQAYTTSADSRCHSFNLVDAYVYAEGVNFETPDNPEPALPVIQQLFYAGRGEARVELVNSNVYIRDFPLVRASGATTSLKYLHVGGSIKTRLQAPIILNIKPSEILINAVTITDEAGNALTANSLFSGIVKDANGVPRNVISNLIL